MRSSLCPCSPSRALLFALASLLIARETASAQQDERTVDQIADGVYVIRHRTSLFEGGNTTVVIGDRDVLVVDACQIPYAAREDIAEIRRLTSKPVRWLVNTHWHNDHVMGNHDYLTAFPGIAIVAHVETRRDMDLNIPKAPIRSDSGYAAFVATVEKRIASGTNEAGQPLTPAGRVQLENLLGRAKQTLADYRSFVYQAPTLTFERELVLDLGNREVRISHLGRGNTSGDAVVYLPAQKVVASGDLLVSPLPFPYDGYPSEWIGTLGRLGELDAQIIVPGHGPVLRDKTYLYLVRDLLRSAVDQVNARLHVIGPAEFQQVENVLGHVDLSPFKQRFAGANEARARRFDEMATQVVRLVFKEAALR